MISYLWSRKCSLWLTFYPQLLLPPVAAGHRFLTGTHTLLGEISPEIHNKHDTPGEKLNSPISGIFLLS